jgi:hypothetical protein
MRGRPFQKGVSPNPGGRPKSVGHIRVLARAHSAEAIRTLLTVMKNAKSPPAARVAAATAMLDRGHGRPGPPSVRFFLPNIDSAGDAAVAMTAITKAVACGEVTPTEALDLSRLVESYVKTIEACDLEKRLQVLEASLAVEKGQ